MSGHGISLEGHPGLGSEHRCFTHKYGRGSDRNGSIDEEDVDRGRKTKCPGGGRGSMEQGEEPSPLCAAEGERVYSSCRLGQGGARKKEAGRVLQEPDRISSPAFTDRSGAGRAGNLAKRPAGFLQTRCGASPAVQRYRC